MSSFRHVVLLSLAAFAMATCQTALAAPQADARFVEADLEFDKIVPVLLQAGAGESTGVVQFPWVVFRNDRDGLRADLRLVMISSPKGLWRVTVALLDEDKGVLADASAVLENSGLLLGHPWVDEHDVRLGFEARDSSRAQFFRVSVEQAPPETQPTAQLVSLPKIKRVKGTRSFKVRVPSFGKDSNDRILLTTWRKSDSVTEATPLSARHGRPVAWRDGASTWRACRLTETSIGTHTIANLPEGFYRVTAVSAQPRGNDGVSLIGASDVVDLTTNKPTPQTVFRPAGRHELTVRLVDARTRKPLSREHIQLYAPDGMPVASRSGHSRTWTNREGVVRFTNLEAGIFRVEVGPRDWWSEVHPESVVVASADVQPNRHNEITVSFTQHRPEYRPLVSTE